MLLFDLKLKQSLPVVISFIGSSVARQDECVFNCIWVSSVFLSCPCAEAVVCWIDSESSSRWCQQDKHSRCKRLVELASKYSVAHQHRVITASDPANHCVLKTSYQALSSRKPIETIHNTLTMTQQLSSNHIETFHNTLTKTQQQPSNHLQLHSNTTEIIHNTLTKQTQ